jgi:hypothetical protein
VEITATLVRWMIAEPREASGAIIRVSRGETLAFIVRGQVEAE